MTELDVVGPFGVFTLRDGRDSDIVFVGGGAGMAPILCLLRPLAERGSTRKATYYYGARPRRDLCFEEELRALEEMLPNFRYVPALSEPDDDDWDGEVGLITDVVQKHETDLAGADSYVCGPPPMVEAAMAMLGCARGGRQAHLLRQVHDHRPILTEHERERGGPDMTHRSSTRGRPAGRRGAQRPQAGVHRRRGRRQGVPGLDGAQLQLLHAARSASSRTTRTSPSRCSPTRGTTSARAGCTASPTVVGGYPLDWTALKAWGSRPARAGALPGLRAARATTGRRTAGTSSATPTRSGSSRSTATTPTSCARSTQNIETARQSKAFDAVEPQLGARSSSATSARGCTSSTVSGSTCSPTPTGVHPRTCTTTRSR